MERSDVDVRERALRSHGLRQRGSKGLYCTTKKSGWVPQNSAPARRAVALQFALRKNHRKTVTCRKYIQSARRFGSGRGTKGSARQSVPSDGWKWWTAFRAPYVNRKLRSTTKERQNLPFHTLHETRYRCRSQIAVGLPLETVRRRCERRPNRLTGEQPTPHAARVFRRLLPLPPASARWTAKPAGRPGAQPWREGQSPAPGGNLSETRGEQCGVGANVRTSSFTPAQMS